MVAVNPVLMQPTPSAPTADLLQHMAATQASRGKLHEAVARARFAGQRTIISVRGKPAAVLCPLEDLAHLPRAVPTDGARAPEKGNDR